MDDAQKKMKKYTNAVERRLHMPREVRARVMNDFISSIHARREEGQNDAQIYRELGSPAKAAAELNEQMKEYTYVKSPWRWACLTAAVLSSIYLLMGGSLTLAAWLMNQSLSGSIGIIGGADGPTAIFVTTSADSVLYQLGLVTVILVAGLAGFFRLSRCKRK